MRLGPVGHTRKDLWALSLWISEPLAVPGNQLAEDPKLSDIHDKLSRSSAAFDDSLGDAQRLHLTSAEIEKNASNVRDKIAELISLSSDPPPPPEQVGDERSNSIHKRL